MVEQIVSSLSDFSPAMTEVAGDFHSMIQEQFSSAGAAGGTPWAPLAPSTLRRKRNGGGQLLEQTGALLDSLVDEGASGHVEETGPMSLSIGSDLGYAGFFQTGTGWGRGEIEPPSPPRHGRGMPMRPVLVLTESHRQQWIQFLFQQVDRAVQVLGASELQGMRARR